MAKKKDKPEKSVTVRKPQAGPQSLPSVFDSVFGQPFLSAFGRGILGDEETWAPSIHVLEKEDKYVAKVELPGVNEEDVTVLVLGDMLVVEGENRRNLRSRRRAILTVRLPTAVSLDQSRFRQSWTLTV